jgi:hypothetical protein
MSDQSVVPGKEPLAARIEQEKSHPLAWKTVVKRAAMAVVAGIAIYLVFPAITEVLASWPRLSTLHPWWLFAAIGAEILHFACTFAVQRLALRTRAWFPVVTSQLAGNAVTLIMPGGAAVGAAVQFRMLAASGMATSETVGGLAAYSLLGVGGLLALPVFALPVILLGAPINRGLEHAAFLGAAGFVAFAAFGAVILAYDAPFRWTGRTAQQVANWVLRKRPPLQRLDETLLAKRDEIRATLGQKCRPTGVPSCSTRGRPSAGPATRYSIIRPPGRVRRRRSASMAVSAGVGGRDPGRGDQDGDPPLLGHDPVVGVPVVVRPARGGEDLAEQQAEPFGVHPGHGVVGSGQLDRALDGGPLPARPGHHGGTRPGPQVGQAAGAAHADQADDLGAGHRMREHARVRHRRLDGSVRPQRGYHAQAVIALDQPGEVYESVHR